MSSRCQNTRVSAKTVSLKMCCEWDTCQDVFHDMDDFIEHVQSHLHLILEHMKTQDGQLKEIGTVACEWRECGHETERDFIELVRHVYFHMFHAKIKNLGEYLIAINKQQCLLDSTSRNMIPELPDRLQCSWTDCKRIYDNPERFYQHVSCHADLYSEGNHPKEGAKCDWEGCGVVFRSKHKLRDHLRSHTQEKVVACPNCGSLFSSNTKFVDHLNRQRESHLQSYQCSHCRKKFPSERLLRDHMRHHVNHYKCPMCDMTCPCPSTLRRHMLHRHTQEKPFNCSQCDAKFTVSSDLRKHEDCHGTSSYQCHVDQCSYKCYNYPSLSNHFKKQHQGVDLARFACHICDKRFTRGAKLTAHLKNKHTFKWPSGHRRFRYKEMEDGFFRLQTIRYESIELTEQILTDKLKKVRPSDVQLRLAAGEGTSRKKTADWSYNLEMLGEVALKVPKVNGKDDDTEAGDTSHDHLTASASHLDSSTGSNDYLAMGDLDTVAKRSLSERDGDEDSCDDYQTELDEEEKPPSRKRARKSSHPQALQSLGFHTDSNSVPTSDQSLDSDYSNANSPMQRELGKLHMLGASYLTKENCEPIVVTPRKMEEEEVSSNSTTVLVDHPMTVAVAPSGELQHIQVSFINGAETIATVTGNPCSVIIDPTTGSVEYAPVNQQL